MEEQSLLEGTTGQLGDVEENDTIFEVFNNSDHESAADIVPFVIYIVQQIDG